MSSNNPSGPSAAQIQSINAALNNLGGLNRFALQDRLRQLPGLLAEGELMERVLVVEYQHDDTCLLVATNFRAMLLSDKFFSFSKAKVRDFPYQSITDVEWAPGRFRHRITIRMGRKKEECYGLWRDGTFPARKMAEHLASKLPGGTGSLATDAKIAKVHAIEDIAKSLSLVGCKAELKELPEVLEADEMPENMLNVEHDDRHGLQVSGAMNRQGLLVGTDRQLMFVHKHLGAKREVHQFPYSTIDHVGCSKGLFMGELKVYSDGLEEIFKADNWTVESFAQYLSDKIDWLATRLGEDGIEDCRNQ